MLPSSVTSKVSAKVKDMMKNDPTITENLRKSTLSLSAMTAEVEELASFELLQQKKEEALRRKKEQAKSYHADYKAKLGVKSTWAKAAP